MQIISRAWRGEEKLWKVFWLLLVPGDIVLGMLDRVVQGHGIIAEQASNAVFYAYTIWVLTSCWRCAFNVRQKLWGYVARAMAAILLVLTVLSLFAILGMTAFLGPTHTSELINARSHARQDLKSCEDTMKEDAAAASQTPEEYTKQHEAEYKDCWAKAMGNAMSQQMKVMDSAVKSMEPADTVKACEESMTADAKRSGMDPVTYAASTENVGAWCSPALMDAIRAKYASSPDAEIRARYAKAASPYNNIPLSLPLGSPPPTRSSIEKREYQDFLASIQYFPPGIYADGRKGICTYNEFAANKPAGGSEIHDITFEACASEFKTIAHTWCRQAIEALPPNHIVPAGEILMTQQFNFGPQRNLEENPGPDAALVARYECRRPTL